MTVEGKDFQTWIEKKIQERDTKVIQEQDEELDLHPDILEQFLKSNHSSCKYIYSIANLINLYILILESNSKSYSMLKSRAKKKATKLEMEARKAKEENDKQLIPKLLAKVDSL